MTMYQVDNPQLLNPYTSEYIIKFLTESGTNIFRNRFYKVDVEAGRILYSFRLKRNKQLREEKQPFILTTAVKSIDAEVYERDYTKKREFSLQAERSEAKAHNGD